MPGETDYTLWSLRFENHNLDGNRNYKIMAKWEIKPRKRGVEAASKSYVNGLILGHFLKVYTANMICKHTPHLNNFL